MEQNNSDSSSDRDRDMMRRPAFEAFGDDSEKHDDKAEKKKKKKKAAAEKQEEAAEKQDLDDKKEKKEKTELIPLTELTGEETKRIVEEIVENTEPELAAELESTEPDSPEEFAVLSDAEFIETLKERAGSEEELDQSDIDEAYEDTIRSLELEGFDELPASEDIDADEEDDEITAPVINNKASVAPTPPPTAPLAQGASGGLPPRPPIPPRAPVPPIGGLPPLGPMPSPNTIPPNPNTVANSVEQVTEPSRNRADLLVGGIIGYLIGRRRGRIKTEERLMPVQEKLEKQVRDLQADIAEKESKIRKLAVVKAMKAPEAVRQQIVEKLETLDKPAPPENLETTPIVTERETVVIKSPEKVGRAIIAPFKIEQERLTPQKPERNVETMTMPEILEISAQIKVDGISVKEMYESNKLDAIGLRRVVKEYLSGGRYERVIRENLKGEEYTRERAVEQDSPGQQAGGSAYGSGSFSPPAPVTADNDNSQNGQWQTAGERQPGMLAEIHEHKSNSIKLSVVAAAGVAIAIVVLFLLT